MSKNQKKYTQELKQQIVDLYYTGIYSFLHLLSEYGVAKSIISGWIKQLTPIKVLDSETISIKEYEAFSKKVMDFYLDN